MKNGGIGKFTLCCSTANLLIISILAVRLVFLIRVNTVIPFSIESLAVGSHYDLPVAYRHLSKMN